MRDTKKTIVLCKDMLNRQMYYVLNTGRHVTLTGIMYKTKQNSTCNLTRLEELQSRHHMQHATTYHAAKLEQAPTMLV